MLYMTWQHVQITLLAVLFAFVIAYAVAMLMYKYRFLTMPVNGICNAIFAIPTLAMFSILIPVTGLGADTAIVTLVLYNQFILTKSIYTAFTGIAPSVIESAEGMGMKEAQIYREVKLPLALPGIMSGIKMSVVSTITMATLSATIGAGGLGVLLFQGIATRNWNQLLWGVILSTLLALLASTLLQKVEDYTLKKSRGEGSGKI